MKTVKVDWVTFDDSTVDNEKMDELLTKICNTPDLNLISITPYHVPGVGLFYFVLYTFIHG